MEKGFKEAKEKHEGCWEMLEDARRKGGELLSSHPLQ